MTEQLLTREYAASAQSSDDRTVSGIAVPYGDEIEYTRGYFETIAPDAFDPETNGPIKLFWSHRDVIGTVTEARNTPEGLEITARISETSLGNDAYALARDGAIDRFSIGFISLASDTTQDEDGNTHVVHTSIAVREVSLVPFPAYNNAVVTEVRSTPEPEKETPMTDTLTPALDEINERMASLEQAFAAAAPAPAPAVDTRSAGEVLKALVTGDENETRAYNGTVSTADGTMTRPTWIGDLTRLVDSVNPLKALFQTGALPPDGLNLEFTELATNSIAVNAQAVEGDDLQIGKISTREKTTPVKTFGGYTQLTRQAIERTRVNLLQVHLNGMALAAGQASANYFASVFAATVKERAASALTSLKTAVSALTWSDIVGLTVDAAAAFQDAGLPLDGLIIDKATFKALAALTASDGRPLMTVSGTGANTVGEFNPAGLTGDIVGIKVTPNLMAKPDELGTKVVGAFYSSLAMRTYETPVAQLQDENILNLSKAFSVYRYQAVAAEIPSGLVPLKLA